MARKPKPAALRILQGHAGHRPINNAVDLPVDHLQPPFYLRGYALEEWNRMEPLLRGAGVVTIADCFALASYCAAVGRVCSAEKILAAIENPTAEFVIRGKDGRMMKNPISRARDEARAEGMRYASELGITPSSRTGIVPVFAAKPANKFSGIGVVQKPRK